MGAYSAAAPLLILSAELDDWTPAEPCQRLTDVARAQGQHQAGRSVLRPLPHAMKTPDVVVVCLQVLQPPDFVQVTLTVPPPGVVVIVG